MTNTEKIAQLNDLLRHTFTTGRVVLTPGVRDLPSEMREQVLSRVHCFDGFDLGNDLYGERDFGAFEVNGESYFWKIDYFDADFQYLSPDPTDPKLTRRVLTIMRADEY